MAGTPISIRLDPLTTQTLQEAALAAGSPVATFAAHLIRDGLAGASVAVVEDDDESDLEKQTFQLLEGVPGVDAEFQLEAALLLAKLAAECGPSAVAAVKELRVIVAAVPTNQPEGDFA